MALTSSKWFRNFFVQETPSGTVNGVNDTFTLTHTPVFNSMHMLHVNGLLLSQGVHYTLSGNTITFLSGFIPATASHLLSVYIRSL